MFQLNAISYFRFGALLTFPLRVDRMKTGYGQLFHKLSIERVVMI